jgi:GDP-D-mannose dehydratase
MPEYTANVDGLGTLRILDAIRSNSLERILHAFTKHLPANYTEKSLKRHKMN